MIVLTAYIIFISDNILREVIRFKNKAPVFNKGSHDQYSSYLTALFIYIVVLLPFFPFSKEGQIINTYLRIFGLLISFVGLLIHLHSLKILGKYYTGMLKVSTEQNIVKNGLYKWIRHPGYLGMMLLSIGFSIAIGHVFIVLLTSSLYILIYGYRIYVEEKMLTEHFGVEYIKYMKQTKRLIPFLF